MKKLFLLLPLVIIIAAGCTLGNSPSASNTPSSALKVVATGSEALNAGLNSELGTTTTIAGSMKLVDSPYADNAYLISGDILSAEAQKALTGFTLNKQLQSDGSTLISLTATNPEYSDQKYVIQTGQSLYFVDRMLSDDSGIEGNQADDFGLITDGNGYIVPSSLPLP
ncbi:MAG: hypothetical protein WC467_01770 [Patescibacteria group bacterium]